MFLADPNNCRLVIAVLVQRLGGETTVTEDELREVSFKFLDEHERGSEGKLDLAVSTDDNTDTNSLFNTTRTVQ